MRGPGKRFGAFARRRFAVLSVQGKDDPMQTRDILDRLIAFDTVSSRPNIDLMH